MVGFTENPELCCMVWVAGMVTHNYGVGCWDGLSRTGLHSELILTHGSQGGAAGIPGRVICMEVCCDESGLFVNRRLRVGRTWGSGVGVGGQELERTWVGDPLCSQVGSGKGLHLGLENLFCVNARSLAWLTRL